GGTFLADPDSTMTFKGPISGPGSFTKAGPGAVTILGDNDFEGGTIISDGTLVVGNLPGSHNEAERISTALGTGPVSLEGGMLRATSLETGIPLTIIVGHDYTQSGGTLKLGMAGTNLSEFDRLEISGKATLNGTLSVFSLNNFRPQAGDAFQILRSGLAL